MPRSPSKNSQAQYLLGVDVGGTKTEVCLITLNEGAEFHDHTVLARERISTRNDTSLSMPAQLQEYLKRLNELVEKVLNIAHLEKSKILKSNLLSIGIGLPGSIDPVTQQMVAGSIEFFKGVHLPTEFRQALHTDGVAYPGNLVFDNDANCFALAETYLGAGKTWAKENQVPFSELCLLGVTLGTGVGGGIFVSGNLIRGRRGGAGEVGHMTLIESGRACYCGKFGCAEQYLSGTAFEYSYATRASALEKCKGFEIFEKSAKGDPLASSVIDTYRDYLVTFLSNLSNCLDPHVIVLGGGMSNQERIYSGISERLSQACFLTANPPAVIRNECGDSAGVLGAAMLGLWDFIKKEKDARE